MCIDVFFFWLKSAWIYKYFKVNILCEYCSIYQERSLWLKCVMYFRHKQFAKFRVMSTELFCVNKISLCFWQPYHIISFMSGCVLKIILMIAWSYQIPLMVLKFSNFCGNLFTAFVLYQHYSFNLLIFILLIHLKKNYQSILELILLGKGASIL